jgi:diguanylate cyclase (GGDEF)-like protein
MKSLSADPLFGQENAEEYAAMLAELDLLRRKIVELEQLADTDTLTPLANRRAFLRAVDRAIRLADRHQTQTALAFLDVDGLKAINDAYGHITGDAVLLHISERLRSAFRVTDLAARVSGDEFAILLDHVSEDDAQQRIGALVAAVANDPVRVGQKDLSIRLSWGLTMIRADDSVDVAMGRADAAMYRARSAQRSDR